MGAVEKSAGLTGARIGDWFATNIAPNRQTGIGTWSIEETVAFLKGGQNKRMATSRPASACGRSRCTGGRRDEGAGAPAART